MKLINLGSRTPQDVPDVRFRPSLIDHVLEGIAFLPVLANWIYILYRYRLSGGDLPSDLYLSGGTALFLFILLGVGGYLPSRFINFPFRVRAHNLVVQYILALRLIRVHLPAISLHHSFHLSCLGECRFLRLCVSAVGSPCRLYGTGLAQTLR